MTNTNANVGPLYIDRTYFPTTIKTTKFVGSGTQIQKSLQTTTTMPVFKIQPIFEQEYGRLFSNGKTKWYPGKSRKEVEAYIVKGDRGKESDYNTTGPSILIERSVSIEYKEILD